MLSLSKYSGYGLYARPLTGSPKESFGQGNIPFLPFLLQNFAKFYHSVWQAFILITFSTPLPLD